MTASALLAPVTLAPAPARDRDRPAIAPRDLTFVICVEGNVLGSQAILMCESLRRHGGPYRDCPVWAVSPRPRLPVRPEVAARLAALGVEVVAEPLNQTGSAYGSINRVLVGAWAEARVTTPFLCVLDTDMLFLRPPRFVRADVGVRSVDMRGMASRGPGDRMEDYWKGICRIAGISIDRLPIVRTTCCKSVIRASYNGGFLVANRHLGVLAQTARIFLESFRQDLRPLAGATRPVHASTGMTGLEAASWWGSSQAALSTAISRQTGDVVLYRDAYNIPLHIFARPGPLPFDPGEAVLVHYHYLAAEGHRADFLRALDRIGCPAEVRGWVAARAAELPWPLA